MYRKTAIMLVCLMMPTGCAVGPDFKSPEPPQTQTYTAVALNRLIRMGLNDSPTVAAAQAALRRARENMRAQSGTTWFPQLNLGLSAGRRHTNNAAYGSFAGGATTFNLYSASA